ncbi:MAG: response regulator transcription factor [Spirochaetales bacterium]|nr:response regulator transcription factor [Spirochaetales bacterium]
MKVLIVDDDKDFSCQLKEKIEESEIFCDICHSRDDAMVAVQRNLYDLVVLDIQLDSSDANNHDGISLLEFIRLSNMLQPVIMLSGNNSLDTRVRCFDKGCDDFIEKPFLIRELLAIIKRQIEKSLHYRASSDMLSLPGAPLRYLGAFVDFSTMTISRGDLSISGRSKLVSLFSLLIRNQGCVLPREILFSLVWGSKEYDENSLNVHICQLRNILEDNPRRPKHLKTVRGVGYILEKV